MAVFFERVLVCFVCFFVGMQNWVGALFGGGTSAEEKVCMGYIASWGFEDESDLAATDFTKLTHVNYAFALIDGYTLLPYLEEPGQLEMLVRYAKTVNPDVKILLSIGGWGADYFCEASSTEENRNNFAEACAELIEQYGLDGVDIDWEYPGRSDADISSCDHCVTDFTLLMQAIRNEIGEGKLLTFAAGGTSSQFISDFEPKKIAQIVDYVNVMNYDYSPDNVASFRGTKASLLLLQYSGFAKDQIVFGVPFYGRTLYGGSLSYAQIVGYVADGEMTVDGNRDETFGYLGEERVSFDTPGRIAEKIHWAVDEMGYAGVMCWELTQDYENDLLNTMYSNTNGDKSYSSPYIS